MIKDEKLKTKDYNKNHKKMNKKIKKAEQKKAAKIALAKLKEEKRA